MSHITQMKTKFTDIECLTEACREFGLTLETGEGLTVRDYYGKTVPVDARISLGQYGLGFQRQEDGTLQMVADFWGIAKYSDAPKVKAACAGITGSIDAISQEAQRRLAVLFDRPYAVAVTKKEVRTNPRYRGFSVQEERNEQGEVVRLTLARRSYS